MEKTTQSNNMSHQSTESRWAPLAIGFFLGIVTLGAVVFVWNHDREPPRYAMVSPPDAAATPSTASAVSSTGLSLLRPPAMAATMAGMDMTPAAASAPDPALARVAARFLCSCADHCEKTVEVCTCETAQAERTFLQKQLKEGRTEAEAARAVQQTYGGLKL